MRSCSSGCWGSKVNSLFLKSSQQVWNVRCYIWFRTKLYIKSITGTTFYHLKILAKLTQVELVHVFIYSRLDYEFSLAEHITPVLKLLHLLLKNTELNSKWCSLFKNHLMIELQNISLTCMHVVNSEVHQVRVHSVIMDWNKLPDIIRCTTTLSSFKIKLKTYLFSQMYG